MLLARKIGTYMSIMLAEYQANSDRDEWPNGRWGDARSPAFGELDAYDIGLKGTNEANIKLWGEPRSLHDVSKLFVKYIEKDLERLPWSEAAITDEAASIKDNLIDMNKRGLLTINSQPAIDGIESSHQILGWGPPNGYVYQKAYLELLVAPSLLSEVLQRIKGNKDLTFYATNKSGDYQSNTGDSPNAVTWGIFPGREIIQPTIVETISFLAWKDEAFRLGDDWAKCYSNLSPSRKLIQNIMDTYYLINIGKPRSLSAGAQC